MTYVTAPSATEPPHSPLLRAHIEDGATLTEFAGWQMPLRWRSDLAEHHAVRTSGGLFDLSHMAQIEIEGPGAAAGLDKAVVSAVGAIQAGRAKYTMVVAPDGGVMDDVIVYRLAEDSYFVVANAANRATVVDAFTRRCGDNDVAVIDRTTQRALLAVQGPSSAEVLAQVADVDVDTLKYYRISTGVVAGTPALLARTGYTGEDGFEISIPATAAEHVWAALREAGESHEVSPCGLACRDTLRLEAGMPLYGHELTRETTPFDAGLGRVVQFADGREFVGAEALAARARESSSTRLVGLAGSGRRAARAGYPVLTPEGGRLGQVTSGALSPTLGHPIAMAYVRAGQDELPEGADVVVDVRGSHLPMTVVPLPFYRRPR